MENYCFQENGIATTESEKEPVYLVCEDETFQKDLKVLQDELDSFISKWNDHIIGVTGRFINGKWSVYMTFSSTYTPNRKCKCQE